MFKLFRWREPTKSRPPEPVSTETKKSFSVALSTALIAGAVSLGLAAVSTPKFAAARQRANSRTCYANQKTIVGAIEMYALERKPPQTQAITDLMSVAPSLVASGYLLKIPDDPGEGSGSSKNYFLTTEGNGIRCSVHGSIE